MAEGAFRRIAGLALAAAIALTTTACNLPAGSVASPKDRPAEASLAPSSPEPTPASLAGGACLLMDYGVINDVLGTDFDVAAAADKSDSYTCVMQSAAQDFPDLTLSITATDLTTSDFKADVKPSKSATVKELGKIGYEVERAADKTNGPAIEVGWLSGNERLIVLTFAYPQDGTVDPAMVDNVIELAKKIDGTTV